METIDEEYENNFWPQLRDALNILFLNTVPFATNNSINEKVPDGGLCQRISFEQMYSAVYKCVCKQYSERLYNDLINHVDNILQRYVNRFMEIDYKDYSVIRALTLRVL